MKPNPPPPPAAPATLQTVLDRLARNAGLSDTRKRDLRSAVICFAKLRDQPPAAIPLDLADIRLTLDGMVAAQAKVSRKRWANIRSDLATAIDASGLRPMIRTANVGLDQTGASFLRQPTNASAMRFPVSPDLRGCAKLPPRLSMTGSWTASSTSSMRRP